MYGYMNVSDVARQLGISFERLDYHIEQLRVPAPTHQVGQRLYYLPSEYPAIEKAYLERKRKPRTKRGAK